MEIKMLSIISKLSSLKLTLFLIFILICICIAGTLVNYQYALDEIFYSPWFWSILGIFSIHLICCVLKSLSSHKKMYDKTLFIVLHASILIIFSGAFIGRVWGSHGILWLYEGESKNSFLDERKMKNYFQEKDKNQDGQWDHKEVALWEKEKANLWKYDFDKNRKISYKEWCSAMDEFPAAIRNQLESPLNFTVSLEKFATEYHPNPPRLFAKVRNTRIEEIFEVKPNALYSVPFTSYQVHIKHYDDKKEFVPEKIHVTVSKGTEQESHDLPLLYLSSQAQEAERLFLENISLIYYLEREASVKSWKSLVRVLEDGKSIKQETILVNHPLSHKGLEIFQASYFTDAKKQTKSGLHVVYDPGIFWVYLGFSILSLSLLLQFFRRIR